MALEFKDDNFEEEVLKSDKPVLVDFWAPWCGPCQMMTPIIEDLSKDVEGKAKVGKINIDENSKIAQKYGIMSIPTLIIFKDGEILKQMAGIQSKESLQEELKKAE
jgi:thioredoxin 1